MQVAELQNRPETHQFNSEHRRYYDTVTWLAEVLPGSMRTPFEYRFNGHELYASDNGALRPIFEDAVKQAEHLPVYEQRRRRVEMGEYEDMLAMARGELPNTMVTVSDFPPELMNASRDEGGYNVSRKQTMLRVITRNPDNTISMYSQSLDGSDRTALEAMYASLGYKAEPGELLGQRMHLEIPSHDQEFLIDQLMGVYDRSLEMRYGGTYWAGIRNGKHQNTYEFVRNQTDLLQAYLAATHSSTGGSTDYNLAAAMLARYQKHCNDEPVFAATAVYEQPAIAAHVLAMQEMNSAGAMARSQGIVVSGCGKTITLGEQEGVSAADQLSEAGFGNKADSESSPKDKFGPLKFKCKFGHWNERPRNILITRCRVASCRKGSVGC